MGKAVIQGTIGWQMGVYGSLSLGILTEVFIDVLVLTTALTIVDPSDQHNWGLDDLARGVVENNRELIRLFKEVRSSIQESI